MLAMTTDHPFLAIRRRVGLAGVCLLLLVPACGGPSRKPVFPVTGQVFDNHKKPAAGAAVIFHPVNPDAVDQAKPVGHVDDRGNFSLTTYEKDDGAAEGEYVVTIEWRPPKKTPFEPEPPDRLEGRYSNSKTSVLRARIEKQSTTLKPFVVQ
jgi:hypothetical protein